MKITNCNVFNRICENLIILSRKNRLFHHRISVLITSCDETPLKTFSFLYGPPVYQFRSKELCRFELECDLEFHSFGIKKKLHESYVKFPFWMCLWTGILMTSYWRYIRESELWDLIFQQVNGPLGYNNTKEWIRFGWFH